MAIIGGLGISLLWSIDWFKEKHVWKPRVLVAERLGGFSMYFPFKNTGMQRQQGPAPPLGGSPHSISGYKWLITIVITILITIVITCYEPFKDGIYHENFRELTHQGPWDNARDQVPNGGGIVIQGPLGFEFPNPCQPEAGRRKMKETDRRISLRKNERI